jgi:hypothetical protein
MIKWPFSDNQDLCRVTLIEIELKFGHVKDKYLVVHINIRKFDLDISILLQIQLHQTCA